MNKGKDLAMFSLFAALAGYRLVIIDDSKIPGIGEYDIMVARSLYNKMKQQCPDLFDDKEK